MGLALPSGPIDYNAFMARQGVRKQIFYGGHDEIEKMGCCEISKILLYKSQEDGGPVPPRPFQFRTPCI